MKPWQLLLNLGLFAGLASSTITVTETSSLFAANATLSTQSFTGATFTPKVAPVVTPTLTARTIELAWSPVTSAKAVNYLVTRTGPNGTPAEVCTGQSAPTLVHDLIRCTDTSALPGVSYTYSEQPFLNVLGSLPWSRPPSSPSTQITAPRLSYVGTGPDVSSTGAAISVPYPSDIQHGDLLLFIAICGTNKAPATPAGWTTLVSKGIGGSSSAYLYIAWQVANGSGEPTFDPRSNGSGASARIINYGKFQAALADPVVATTSPASGSASATTTFTPSPNVVTTQSEAVVISIVALSSANSPTVTTARGFTQRISANLYPGSGTLALGVADALVLAAGSTSPSPTWSQSGIAKDWLYATIAFR